MHGFCAPGGSLGLVCGNQAKTNLWVQDAGEPDLGLMVSQQQPNPQLIPQGIGLPPLLVRASAPGGHCMS